MGSPAYDGIYFDLDYTLCEPTQDRAKMLETTFERAGVESFCTFEEFQTVVPTLTPTDTTEEFVEQLFTEVATRAGVDPGHAPTLAECYLEVSDPSAVRFRPGAKEALAYASERSIGVGLITNGERERQLPKLDALGITDVFDVRVYTDPDRGIPPKPNSTPFERALTSLDVLPERAVHVGDTVHADVAGANAVGMDSVWIDTGRGAGPHTDTSASARHADNASPTYELDSLERFDTIV